MAQRRVPEKTPPKAKFRGGPAGTPIKDGPKADTLIFDYGRFGGTPKAGTATQIVSTDDNVLTNVSSTTPGTLSTVLDASLYGLVRNGAVTMFCSGPSQSTTFTVEMNMTAGKQYYNPGILNPNPSDFGGGVSGRVGLDEMPITTKVNLTGGFTSFSVDMQPGYFSPSPEHDFQWTNGTYTTSKQHLPYYVDSPTWTAKIIDAQASFDFATVGATVDVHQFDWSKTVNLF